MIEMLKRPVGAFMLSIALAGSAYVGVAHAQVAPTLGVQPVAPTGAGAQLPPPSLGPSDNSGGQSSVQAPLASSSQGCQGDISKISGRRMSAIDALNKLAKANKGKLDPITACPRFKALVRVETEFRDYLIKNKDWCDIPEQVLDTVRQSTEKDSTTSVRACALAVQFKKAQAQAAQGVVAQAPRLPSGPL